MNSNYSSIPVRAFEVQDGAGGSPESDASPLILDGGGGGGVVETRRVDEGSGISGAVFNLATSIIGAGIMALPATMKVLGVAVGLVSIVVMGVLSEISIELLVRFSDLCNSSSYGELVNSALGRPARLVAEICVVVNNAGVLTVYLIIIGDVLSGSAKHVGVFDQWLGSGGIWSNRELVIFLVVVLFLAPLCSLDKIDSLSLTSAASVALAVIFVLVSCAIALVKLFDGKLRSPRLSPDLRSSSSVLDLLVVIPIMTNAYVCHFNVQPIYDELSEKSPQKMHRVGRITTALCIVVYAATAVSGYLLFGDDTDSDVLTNFDRDLGIRFSAALNYIVRVGYVLHLILVFPVVHFSLRRTIDSMISGDSAQQTHTRLLLLTTVLLGAIYFLSTVIPNIWIAFKFTGATTGLALGFIFPALVALTLHGKGQHLNSGERALSAAMLVLATVVSIVGVAGNIYSLRKISD